MGVGGEVRRGRAWSGKRVAGLLGWSSERKQRYGEKPEGISVAVKRKRYAEQRKEG